MSYDVIVVGGGIIGVSSAFAIATEGLSVALIDPSPAMGSSFAAAGMLAPGAESTPEHAPLTIRSIAALESWPDFAARIAAASGEVVEVERAGSLFAGWNGADRRELTRYLGIATAQSIRSTNVTRAQSPQLFDGLSPRISEANLVEADSYVDPEIVLGSLLLANRALGTEFVADDVRECRHSAGLVEAHTRSGVIRGRCGIVATGYMESPLSIVSSSTRKLRPVRGVTIRLRLDEFRGRPMLRGLIEGRSIYVIFRADGSIVVGATSDETALEVVEASAIRRLLEDATSFVPELDEAEFIEARVGLRPAANDHLPFFEELDDSGWAWSSGHFRHGFLLAPLAADDAVLFAKRKCG